MNEHENESPVPTPEPEQPDAPAPEPEAPAPESQAKLPEDSPPPQPESAQPQAEPAEKPDEPPAPPAPAEPPAAEALVAPQAAEPPAAEAPPPAPVPPAPEPTPARRATAAPDGHWWWGTGRRKAAVARVRIRPGSGKFIVNRRKLDLYFTEERDRNDLTAVLQKTHTHGSLDVHVNVHGGGFTGQAGAIILGLGRALRRYDQSLEPILRDNGFLTRDPRRVERKKYGQRGARRRFQFSKR